MVMENYRHSYYREIGGRTQSALDVTPVARALRFPPDYCYVLNNVLLELTLDNDRSSGVSDRYVGVADIAELEGMHPQLKHAAGCTRNRPR